MKISIEENGNSLTPEEAVTVAIEHQKSTRTNLRDSAGWPQGSSATMLALATVNFWDGQAEFVNRIRSSDGLDTSKADAYINRAEERYRAATGLPILSNASRKKFVDLLVTQLNEDRRQYEQTDQYVADQKSMKDFLD